MTKTGVWLIGARGNVATTAVVGARAIARGLTDETGMVSARPPVSNLDIPGVEDLVFGGHDVRTTPMRSRAEALSREGTPSPAVVEAVGDDLDAVDERIETGTTVNAGREVEDLADESMTGRSHRDHVEAIRSDYADFEREADLDRVVVVYLASTEPPVTDPGRFDSVESVERGIDEGDLPASALYAYAAISEGHPFVNFTPSTGSDLGGLRELADERGVPHVGRDGKTGETLMKSVLAPMFANRHLRVRSWEGHNILGNPDGRVLEDEDHAAGKMASKGDVLDSILPEEFHNAVHIDYAPPLGDRKTAWDDIRFTGFLDTDMTLRFTWEGSDSALAAPLVLDLVRLMAHADEHGEGGVQTHLASFFKAPMDVDEHDFHRQFRLLEEYADRHAEADARSGGERR